MSECGCNSNTVQPKEYDYQKSACIRLGRRDCDCKAIIPTTFVETVEEMKCLKDILVYVKGTNTTYYVNSDSTPMLVWAGPVEARAYDFMKNPLNLRSQFCLSTTESGTEEKRTMYYYDKDGNVVEFTPTAYHSVEEMNK